MISIVQADLFETGSGIGPISVMPDGSLQALLWTYHRMETQIQSNGLPTEWALRFAPALRYPNLLVCRCQEHIVSPSAHV
jgi:hypothetical protein